MKKAIKWGCWAAWVAGLIATGELYDRRAGGIYLLGSVCYAGFVLLLKKGGKDA